MTKVFVEHPGYTGSVNFIRLNLKYAFKPRYFAINNTPPFPALSLVSVSHMYFECRFLESSSLESRSCKARFLESKSFLYK